MEADGFTLVEAQDENNQNRVKVRDSDTGTTILGIS